jgi:hypothetical protein
MLTNTLGNDHFADSGLNANPCFKFACVLTDNPWRESIAIAVIMDRGCEDQTTRIEYPFMAGRKNPAKKSGGIIPP